MERFDSQPPKQPSWDQMDLHKFYFPKFNPDRLLYGEYVFMYFHHITHQASDILRAIMGIASSQAGNEPSKTIFHPREDQIGLQLSADTAQAILPTKRMCFGSKVRSLPSYFKIWMKLMFNNLTQARTGEQLEFSVTSIFKAFGDVYVKVRRESNGIPYALYQYKVCFSLIHSIAMTRSTKWWTDCSRRSTSNHSRPRSTYWRSPLSG